MRFIGRGDVEEGGRGGGAYMGRDEHSESRLKRYQVHRGGGINGEEEGLMGKSYMFRGRGQGGTVGSGRVEGGLCEELKWSMCCVI